MKKIIVICIFALISVINVSSNTLSIMVIMSSDLAPYNQSLAGFKQYLHAQNFDASLNTYILGKTKTSDIYNKLDTENPDMIFTIGTKSTKMISNRIQKVPIIYSMIFHMHMNQAKKNSNITGISLHIPLATKLNYIKKILPKAKRIGLIYTPNSIHCYKEAIKTCQIYNYKLVTKRVKSGKDLDEAIKEIAWKIDLFIMVPDSQLYFPQSVKYLLLETLRRKIPVIGLSSIYTKAGALLSFDCNYKDMGLQAGELAEKIANGLSPSELAPLEPRKVLFSVNKLVADRLGIIIPDIIINEAYKVYPE